MEEFLELFDISSSGLPYESLMKFHASLIEHIGNVKKFGKWMGVEAGQLDSHDDSKWTESEFPAYAMHFHSDEDWADEFSWAWHHHIINNPHHWKHWVIPGDKGKEPKPIPMPRHYVEEMIADWHGASKSYEGSWDIAVWLNRNGPEMVLHDATHTLIDEIMHRVGYVQTDNCPWSYMATDEIRELDI